MRPYKLRASVPIFQLVPQGKIPQPSMKRSIPYSLFPIPYFQGSLS